MLKPTSTQQGENVDMLATAPAGVSLTQENSNFPWGNPQQTANPDEVLTKAIDSLEEPKVKDNMLKLMVAGVSIEALVEGWIYAGFESGEFSLDTGLLIKGPIAMYMANLAEKEGVPYKLFENDDTFDDGEIDDESVLRLMKKNNPRMFSLLNEEANKVIRMGSPKEAMQQVEDTQPQSFLLSEPSVAGKEQL
jgi:hypothetical protein